MTLTRRTLVLAGMTAPLAAPFVARAQSWPSGPMRIVVAYPPGGSTDAIMRLVQPGLQQRLGATDRDREPFRRVGQRRHCRGGEVAARRQHLAGRLRQPCRQSVRAAEPALRQREGSRPGAADRHRALSAHDRRSQAVTRRWPTSSPAPRTSPAPSATARSAAAASDISRWRCCRNAPA